MDPARKASEVANRRLCHDIVGICGFWNISLNSVIYRLTFLQSITLDVTLCQFSRFDNAIFGRKLLYSFELYINGHGSAELSTLGITQMASPSLDPSVKRFDPERTVAASLDWRLLPH